MSLLLDALKRAAEEKLEKQRQQESGAAPAEETLSLDITDAPHGDNPESRDLSLESGTDLRMHRADVLASELQAFMGGSPTEQRVNRAANETREIAQDRASQPAATSAQAPVSAPAATPAAAARLFRNKRSGIRSPRVLLIGGGAAGLLLIGVFYTLYLGSLNESNVRVDRLLASAAEPPPDTAAAARGIERGLLAEQEAIGAVPGEAPGDTNAGGSQAEPTNLFGGRTDDAAIAATQARTENGMTADTSRTASRTEGAMDTPSTRGVQAENSPAADIPAGAEPRLRVRKSHQEPLHDLLLRAYDAYQSGDIATAEAAYRRALARAPASRDALLGFAATAVRKGDYAAALESYTTLLSLDPNDDLALAGMAGLQQHAQGAPADESQIRRLLLRRPDSAQLHFALGNFYSAAADWPKAQSAYFDAHRYDSQNPDYAYNLAVSLEHLGQPATALRYYQLALTLSERREPNFDPAQAAARVSVLQAQSAEPTADAR